MSSAFAVESVSFAIESVGEFVKIALEFVTVTRQPGSHLQDGSFWPAWRIPLETLKSVVLVIFAMHML